MHVTTLGIDLAKQSFELCGVDAEGAVVLKRRVSRARLVSTVAQLSPCLIGLEACGGAHEWARRFTALGHTVRLMSPQFVKPYVKGNKNDSNDAAALCEAVRRPTMRFVPVKTQTQQDIQSLHRMRAGVVKAHTALVNQLRGLLAEYGIVLPRGVAALRRALPALLEEEADNGLSVRFRSALGRLAQRLRALEAERAEWDRELRAVMRADARCRRLAEVAGVGPQVATAYRAAVGDGRAFHNGRQVSAWLGLVPRQHSTGGKARLLGISKRGERYLRTLLIHGARSVVQRAAGKDDAYSRWVNRLRARRGMNKAVVAVANKNARQLWAILNSTAPEPVVA